MKKLLYSAAALALAFFAGSCQQEKFETAEGSGTVTFTVEAPGALASKALAAGQVIADGTNVDILYWEIYDETFTNLLGEDKVKTNGDKTFTVELSLVADQNYNIIFWAEVEGKGHYVTDDLRNVGINYTDTNGNPLSGESAAR